MSILSRWLSFGGGGLHPGRYCPNTWLRMSFSLIFPATLLWTVPPFLFNNLMKYISKHRLQKSRVNSRERKILDRNWKQGKRYASVLCNQSWDVDNVEKSAFVAKVGCTATLAFLLCLQFNNVLLQNILRPSYTKNRKFIFSLRCSWFHLNFVRIKYKYNGLTSFHSYSI